MRTVLMLTLLSALTIASATTQRTLFPHNASEPAALRASLAFDHDAGEAKNSSNDTSLFYSVRPDLRKCASPMCGGYFVKSVNTKSTRCADGHYLAECYVTGIDWHGQAEVEPQKALLRGKIVRKVDPNFGALGLFRVTEVWQAASDNRPVGSFFRVRDLHVRCVAAPCLAQQE